MFLFVFGWLGVGVLFVLQWGWVDLCVCVFVFWCVYGWGVGDGGWVGALQLG